MVRAVVGTPSSPTRLGTFKVGDVKRSDIADLHHGIRHIPYQANRTLGVLSKLFNLAEVWGLRPDGSNPCPGGTFGHSGGGHPHCVVLGNDGLVYVCDRPNNRIQAFKKSCAKPSVNGSQPLCDPERIIYVNNFPGASTAKRNAILKVGAP